MNWIARALRHAAAPALLVLIAACGPKGPGSDSAAPAKPGELAPLPPQPHVPPSFTPDLAAAREARDNLVPFYLRTLDALIKSEHFMREMEITRCDQLAHRLWVPEQTTSRQLALDSLGQLVKTSGAGADAAPFFGDAHQYHRDQYAMIASEVGIPSIGGFSPGQFALGAQRDWGVRRLSVRDDLPWTVTLLSRFVPPGGRWKNSAGAEFSLDDLLRAMIAEKRETPPDNPTVCYHAHKVYAAAAAVAAGYETLRDDANRLLAAEIARARSVCEVMQGVERAAARVKLYGHLIEALYRGGERAFPLEDYRDDLGFMIAALLEDSRALRGSNAYQGPFDIFTGAPHAIHGLDLLLAAHAAPSPAQ